MGQGMMSKHRQGLRRKTIKPRCKYCGYAVNTIYYHSTQKGVNNKRFREYVPIRGVFYCKGCCIISVEPSGISPLMVFFWSLLLRLLLNPLNLSISSLFLYYEMDESYEGYEKL